MEIQTVVGVAQALSVLLSVSFFGYIIVLVVPFLRSTPDELGDASSFDWHFFVPCRDEETVIATTLEYLTSTFSGAHVWIIDDASDDRTAQIAAEFSRTNSYVHLVQRYLPEARTGKGDALNAAYDQLNEFLSLDPTYDRARAIVCVVDADGAPAANCLDVVSSPRLFGKADVGGVQIEVRMKNCDDTPPGNRVQRFVGKQLVRMQDIEFRTVIAAVQQSRRTSNTVGLGGNGQFARLTALDNLQAHFGRPWHGSLLEDFELGLHILLLGWRNAYTATTHVAQEGLHSTERFIVQRTRWGQGVMQCIKYLPKLWSSRHVSNLGALEVGYYLLQPWITLLGTLIYTIPVAWFIYALVTVDGLIGHVLNGWIGVLLLFYTFFGVGIFAIWGIIYRNRFTPERHPIVGLGWGLAYFIYVYGFYLTTWRAFFRIILGRSGWAKTRRNAEVDVRGPVALDH
ncbi:glycosyltransferase family 2 protein [Microbacterium sp. A84]|uniref:glycosyltransferase family 2 protein n=1 Tax=Microbacterium sp. A84 TaxID=3450715 RepID=UPI003F43745E